MAVDFDSVWERRPRFSKSNGLIWPLAWHVLYMRRSYFSCTEHFASTLAVDIYVIACWAVWVTFTAILVSPPPPDWIWIPVSLFLVYRYVDIVGILIQVWVMRESKNGPEVQSVARTLVMTLMNLAEIVLGFGIAFFLLECWKGNINGAFRPVLADLAEAVYFSVVTASTLGYGDIRPVSGFARGLASLEVFTVLLLVLNVINLASSARPLRGADR